MKKYYTDYPFTFLGDIPFQEAPIRIIELLSYDRDKYVKIIVNGITTEIKSGYIHQQPGRHGAVKVISMKELNKLPETTWEDEK